MLMVYFFYRKAIKKAPENKKFKHKTMHFIAAQNTKRFCLFFLCAVLFSCKDGKKKESMDDTAQNESQKQSMVTFSKDDAAKKVDVKLNGKLFTSYRYDGKTPKPVLYPIITKSGKNGNERLSL